MKRDYIDVAISKTNQIFIQFSIRENLFNSNIIW